MRTLAHVASLILAPILALILFGAYIAHKQSYLSETLRALSYSCGYLEGQILALDHAGIPHHNMQLSDLPYSCAEQRENAQKHGF